MDLEIRLSQPEDLAEILELQTIALRQLSVHYTTLQIESLIRSQKLGRLNDEIGFIALKQAQIIGFVSLLKNSPEIGALYVHPTMIRQGIGSQLLEKIEQLARQRGHATLSVTSSLIAEYCYLSNGYTVVRSSGFYSESKYWIPCVNLNKNLISIRNAHPTHWQTTAKTTASSRNSRKSASNLVNLSGFSRLCLIILQVMMVVTFVLLLIVSLLN